MPQRARLQLEQLEERLALNSTNPVSDPLSGAYSPPVNGTYDSSGLGASVQITNLTSLPYFDPFSYYGYPGYGSNMTLMTFTVTNLGNAASGGSNLTLQASVPGYGVSYLDPFGYGGYGYGYGGYSFDLATIQVGSLAPGQSYTQTILVSLPSFYSYYGMPLLLSGQITPIYQAPTQFPIDYGYPPYTPSFGFDYLSPTSPFSYGVGSIGYSGGYGDFSFGIPVPSSQGPTFTSQGAHSPNAGIAESEAALLVQQEQGQQKLSAQQLQQLTPGPIEEGKALENLDDLSANLAQRGRKASEGSSGKDLAQSLEGDDDLTDPPLESEREVLQRRRAGPGLRDRVRALLAQPDAEEGEEEGAANPSAPPREATTRQDERPPRVSPAEEQRGPSVFARRDTPPAPQQEQQKVVSAEALELGDWVPPQQSPPRALAVADREESVEPRQAQMAFFILLGAGLASLSHGFLAPETHAVEQRPRKRRQPLKRI